MGLTKMGAAVLNGGITTIGAAGFMCATSIVFFKKFGIVILVTVCQSLLTSLFFFSAMMIVMGPQGTFGNISLGSSSIFVKRCRQCVNEKVSHQARQQDAKRLCKRSGWSSGVGITTSRLCRYAMLPCHNGMDQLCGAFLTVGMWLMLFLTANHKLLCCLTTSAKQEMWLWLQMPSYVPPMK